jgi:regulatory protein
MDNIVIEVTKRPGGIYQLLLASGEQCIVPLPLLRMYPARKGDKFSYEEYFHLYSADAIKLCAQKADYLLQNRDYSTKVLEEKLFQAGYPQNIVEQVINTLQKTGWLDDHKYAAHYIERRSRQYGKLRIKQELKQKGIDINLIDELFEEHDDSDTLEVAKKYAEKYLKTLKDTDPMKRKQKVIAMLARKGFDYSIAQKAYSACKERK